MDQYRIQCARALIPCSLSNTSLVPHYPTKDFLLPLHGLTKPLHHSVSVWALDCSYEHERSQATLTTRQDVTAPREGAHPRQADVTDLRPGGGCGQVALLATLSNKQRSQLCTVLKPIHVPQGTMLVAKGEVGDAFYIIESGICQVLNDTNQARPSQRLSVERMDFIQHQS